MSEGKIRIELYHKDLLKLNDERLGSEFLRKRVLLQGDDERIEYRLGSKTDDKELFIDNPKGGTGGKGHGFLWGNNLLEAVSGVLSHPNQKSENSVGTIALIYQKAKSHELSFMKKRESSGSANASFVPFFAFRYCIKQYYDWNLEHRNYTMQTFTKPRFGSHGSCHGCSCQHGIRAIAKVYDPVSKGFCLFQFNILRHYSS